MLVQASRDGDLEVVLRLLYTNPFIGKQELRNALFEAVRCSQLEVTRSLVEFSVDPMSEPAPEISRPPPALRHVPWTPLLAMAVNGNASRAELVAELLRGEPAGHMAPPPATVETRPHPGDPPVKPWSSAVEASSIASGSQSRPPTAFAAAPRCTSADAAQPGLAKSASGLLPQEKQWPPPPAVKQPQHPQAHSAAASKAPWPPSAPDWAPRAWPGSWTSPEASADVALGAKATDLGLFVTRAASAPEAQPPAGSLRGLGLADLLDGPPDAEGIEARLARAGDEQLLVMEAQLESQLAMLRAHRQQRLEKQLQSVRRRHEAEQKERASLEDDQCCIICARSMRCVLFLPCRHLCACRECAAGLALCPICRAPIQSPIQCIWT